MISVRSSHKSDLCRAAETGFLAKMSEDCRHQEVDSENRRFNETWTYEFVFILPPHANPKPLCLFCQLLYLRLLISGTITNQNMLTSVQPFHLVAPQENRTS